MPAEVNKLFDFGFNAASFNDAIEDGLAPLQYTAAQGSFDFTDCVPGDLALIRFDFNVTPQIANTTMEVALIWQTRAADGTPTFTFPLTGNPHLPRRRICCADLPGSPPPLSVFC